MPRLFTLDEANALLPALTEIVVEMQARKRELDRLTAELSRLMEQTTGNGHLLEQELTRARRGTEAAAEEVNRLMARIGELGCELKGIDEGLLDFRSMRDERVVYLCWRLGEERIEYWHELDTGFAGRQPL